MYNNIMRLADWIKNNGYNCRSFAKLIKSSHRNVEVWARGERMPRYDVAERIFIATNYEVTGHDLYQEQIQRNKV